MIHRPIKSEKVMYLSYSDDGRAEWRQGVFVMNSIKFGYIIRDEADGMLVSAGPEDIKEPMEESNPNVTFKNREHYEK